MYLVKTLLCWKNAFGVSAPPPLTWANPSPTVAIVLHDYCARHAPPPSLLVCAIHRTILVLAILCEAQRGGVALLIYKFRLCFFSLAAWQTDVCTVAAPLSIIVKCGGVVLLVIVCGVVLVVSFIVWCYSCCVFVRVACFSSYRLTLPFYIVSCIGSVLEGCFRGRLPLSLFSADGRGIPLNLFSSALFLFSCGSTDWPFLFTSFLVSVLCWKDALGVASLSRDSQPMIGVSLSIYYRLLCFFSLPAWQADPSFLFSIIFRI